MLSGEMVIIRPELYQELKGMMRENMDLNEVVNDMIAKCIEDYLDYKEASYILDNPEELEDMIEHEDLMREYGLR